jgi:hypothetical protein
VGSWGANHAFYGSLCLLGSGGLIMRTLFCHKYFLSHQLVGLRLSNKKLEKNVQEASEEVNLPAAISHYRESMTSSFLYTVHTGY